MGRKTKLTSEITDRLCENIELGMPYKLACQAAGICFNTFQNWMKLGEDENAKKEFVTFLNRVRASEAECVKINLQRIDAAATNGNTFYAAWILERRYPEHFGRREKLDIKSKNENENINVNIETTEEIRAEILSKLSPKSQP